MASPVPLGRITRASLARFAHTGDTASRPKRETATTPDIEDILPASLAQLISTTATASRKRKRTVVGGLKATQTVKVDEEEEQQVTTAQNSSTSSTRRARKPARKATDPSTGAAAVTAPSDWEELYAAAKAMRQPGGAAANAAVDTMGCERLADPAASARDQRFHTLVALMLSSQTKDTTNAVAMRRLQTELPPHRPGAPAGLNLENMLAVDADTLNRLIWAVGFHNNKTKYLKQTAAILRDTWEGDIPDTIEGLVSLPGVGPKMAHLCLSSAWGRTEGIGVDVHVHRITNLWGWHKTSTPEQTRLALQSWLPRDKWREINWLLVGLGQTICAPVGRKCGDCELGLSGMCKAADRAKVIQGRKSRAVKVEVKEGDEDDKKAMASKFFKTEETETIVRHVPVSTASLDLAIKEETDPAPVSRSLRRREKRS